MLYWKSSSFCIRSSRLLTLSVTPWSKLCHFSDTTCIASFAISLSCSTRPASDFPSLCNFSSWGACSATSDFKLYSEKTLVYLHLVIYRFIDIKKNNDTVDYLFHSRTSFHVSPYFASNCKIIKSWMPNFDNNFF